MVKHTKKKRVQECMMSSTCTALLGSGSVTSLIKFLNSVMTTSIIS